MSFITNLYSKMHTTVSETFDSIVNPDYKAIDTDLKRIEKFLSKAGWIPGVSLATGAARESMGYLEVVIGLALGCFHQAAARLTKNEETRDKFYKSAEIDFSYCVNGMGNIFRGKLEQAPLWAIPALIYSKLVLIAYDAIALRLNYGHEEKEGREIQLLRNFAGDGKV
ncbi:MAG: hypothetical protein KDK56_05360 [Simkania sp.]|nr:hypothetical protein [Simkania sp.]MCP5491156.1 hypothetical protein [Chlamydiales bacterium]